MSSVGTTYVEEGFAESTRLPTGRDDESDLTVSSVQSKPHSPVKFGSNKRKLGQLHPPAYMETWKRPAPSKFQSNLASYSEDAEDNNREGLEAGEDAQQTTMEDITCEESDAESDEYTEPPARKIRKKTYEERCREEEAYLKKRQEQAHRLGRLNQESHIIREQDEQMIDELQNEINEEKSDNCISTTDISDTETIVPRRLSKTFTKVESAPLDEEVNHQATNISQIVRENDEFTRPRSLSPFASPEDQPIDELHGNISTTDISDTDTIVPRSTKGTFLSKTSTKIESDRSDETLDEISEKESDNCVSTTDISDTETIVPRTVKRPGLSRTYTKVESDRSDAELDTDDNHQDTNKSQIVSDKKNLMGQRSLSPSPERTFTDVASGRSDEELTSDDDDEGTNIPQIASSNKELPEPRSTSLRQLSRRLSRRLSLNPNPKRMLVIDDMPDLTSNQSDTEVGSEQESSDVENRPYPSGTLHGNSIPKTHTKNPSDSDVTIDSVLAGFSTDEGHPSNIECSDHMQGTAVNTDGLIDIMDESDESMDVSIKILEKGTLKTNLKSIDSSEVDSSTIVHTTNDYRLGFEIM